MATSSPVPAVTSTSTNPCGVVGAQPAGGPLVPLSRCRPPAGLTVSKRRAMNRASIVCVAKSETVGAIGGGGLWKSTDSRTETRPVMPEMRIPVPGHALNSLYLPTPNDESLSPVCTKPKSIKSTGRPVMPARGHSPNCRRVVQDVWRSSIESRQHRLRGTSEASYPSLLIFRPHPAIEYGSRQTQRSISGRRLAGSPSDVPSHRSNGLSGLLTQSITRRSATGSGCRSLKGGS